MNPQQSVALKKLCPKCGGQRELWYLPEQYWQAFTPPPRILPIPVKCFECDGEGSKE